MFTKPLLRNFFIGSIIGSAIVSSALYREEIALFLSKETPRLATVVGYGYPRVYVAVGDYYFGGGAYDIRTAQEMYKNALRFGGEDGVPLAHYQLARTYFIEGNFSRALYEIDKELTKYPDYMRSYYVRGLIYGFMGEHEKAAADFETFIEWKKEGWAAYNDLAWVYFMQGDFEKVKEVALRGLGYHPTNPWLNNTVGVALLNLGSKREALEHFKEAERVLNTMKEEDWGKAYPGNDPRSYSQGFNSMREQLAKNIELATTE